MSWEDIENRRAQRRKRTFAETAPDPIDETLSDLFSTPNGEKVLVWLRSKTKEKALNSGISACALRHMEGKRHLVSEIEHRIARGRKNNVNDYRESLGRKSRPKPEHRAKAGWFARLFLGR